MRILHFCLTLALCSVALISPRPAIAAAKDCQDLLLGRTYQCSLDASQVSFEFKPDPATSDSAFRLSVPDAPYRIDMSCVCDDSGDGRALRSFTCLQANSEPDPFGGLIGITVAGKPSGGKGQRIKLRYSALFTSSIIQYVGTCTLAP